MIVLYILSLLGLFVYSFSQIDLNLTLFQSTQFLNFQNAMIQLGYFNRPLSTLIFILLTTLLTVFYLLFLNRSEKIKKKEWIILLVSLSLIGLFSYPAFSHDIFNYIFSGRIVFLHHANPYATTALMFPDDEWVRFMQWTHVPFAWGPVYLLSILPFYLLGLGKFVLTLISFKLMTLLAFLGSVYIIGRLSGKKGMIFFALNPLIIYESLVAAHLDIVMLFFALLSWFYWQKKRYVGSLVSILISIGTKYATITMLPAFFVSKFAKKYIARLPEILIALALLGTLGQVISRELLPHYFIVPIGFIALSKNNTLQKIAIATSILLLLVRYFSFIYTGQWTTIRL